MKNLTKIKKIVVLSLAATLIFSRPSFALGSPSPSKKRTQTQVESPKTPKTTTSTSTEITPLMGRVDFGSPSPTKKVIRKCQRRLFPSTNKPSSFWTSSDNVESNDTSFNDKDSQLFITQFSPQKSPATKIKALSSEKGYISPIDLASLFKKAKNKDQTKKVILVTLDHVNETIQNANGTFERNKEIYENSQLQDIVQKCWNENKKEQKKLLSPEVFPAPIVRYPHIFEFDPKTRGYHYNNNISKLSITNVNTQTKVFGAYHHPTDKFPQGKYSTFFPDNWTKDNVIEGIMQAFKNRTARSKNRVLGKTEDGIYIEMYIKDEMVVNSAFPILYYIKDSDFQNGTVPIPDNSTPQIILETAHNLKKTGQNVEFKFSDKGIMHYVIEIAPALKNAGLTTTEKGIYVEIVNG